MRPLAPGIRFAGVARTHRYERIDVPLEAMPYEEFEVRQYAEGPKGLRREAGRYGNADEVLVVAAGGTSAWNLGSNNTLHARAMGTVGFLIDGACRDSADCLIQKTPVFWTVRSPAHPMGRLRAVSENEGSCARA